VELYVEGDLPGLAAGFVAERAREASGRFCIALAGGSTPRAVYERLAGLDLDWSAWHVWWGDERLVPPDHPDSNERMAREALLSRVPIPEAQIHPLRAPDVELPARFDLVLLGIGPDGHTASLFPGDPALEATDPVVRVERPDHPRLTLTYPVIDAARCVAFMVSGEGKREKVERVLAGDPELPAARVAAERTVILADEAAAPAGAVQSA
jgi:6-phosphogluconolactonase